MAPYSISLIFILWLGFLCYHGVGGPADNHPIGKPDTNLYSQEKSTLKVRSSHGRSDDSNQLEYVIPNYRLQLLARSMYLFTLFLPVASTSGLAYCSRRFRKLVWYKLLCWALSKGGAAMIKWSQWASTRPDMFPEELCGILAELQANAPTHSYSFTAKQIRRELGGTINEIFDEFDRKPVASGSVVIMLFNLVILMI